MTPGRHGALWALAVATGLPGSAAAQGHGPAYGLSTPTLGKGGWSLDVATMARAAGSTQAVMLRPLLSYGVTEDFQLSVSVPVPLSVPPGLPAARAMSRMPTSRDVELLAAWRFHRDATGVGSRLESTLYLGLDYPTDDLRAGARTAPGFLGAGVTGFASRTLYLWIGGLYRRYLREGGSAGDRLGDIAMYTAVVGYRPPAFRKDYPKPDWRIFLEAVGEYSTRTVVGGVERPNSGGHQIFVGPTVLGLFGWWGLSGGPAFPVYRRLNGTQLRENARFIVNSTVWF